MTLRRAALSIAVVGIVTVTGCRPGGGIPDPSAASPDSGAATRPQTTPDTSNSESKNEPRISSPGTESLPETIPGVRAAPLEATLAFSCVLPGQTQEIKIRSHPGLSLSWGTEYPDGAGHQEYGGWDHTKVPDDGVYSRTWAIPLIAPRGDARTDVAVAGKIEGEDSAKFAHLYWTISVDC